jgi:hypothetical protein
MLTNKTYTFPKNTMKVVTYSDMQIYHHLPKSVSALLEEFKEDLMIEKEGAFRHINRCLNAEKFVANVLELATVSADGQCYWNIVI